MRTLLVFSGLFTLLVCPGCGGKQEEPPVAQQVVGPEEKGEWLTTSTIAADIEHARELMQKQEQDAYQQVFDSLSDDSFYFDGDTVATLVAHKDAADKLESQLPKEEISTAGINTAALLCQLHNTAGRHYLTRVLKQGNTAQRLIALNDLNDRTNKEGARQAYREFIKADPELVQTLLQQLDNKDPAIPVAAIQTCGYLELPGLQDKLLEILKRPKAPDTGRILFWLSKGTLNKDVLAAALLVSGQFEEGDAYWGVSLFEALARSDDPELRQPARDELKRMVSKWPASERGAKFSWVTVLATLGETSDKSDLPWLIDTFAKIRGPEAEPLLEALVRLEGDVGRTRLLDLLKEPARQTIAIRVAATHYARTGDEQIVQALADLAKDAKPEQVEEICRALLAVGGDLAHQKLTALLDQLTPASKDYFIRNMNSQGPSLADIQAKLVAAGLVDQATLTAAMDRLPPAPNANAADPRGILDVLRALNLLTEFDVETSTVPCRHDELVRRFAHHSQGGFDPQLISQEYHDPEDAAPSYTLRFVLDGRLYTGRLRNYDDWYDVERVVTMLNQSLTDAKRPQRFLQLTTGDQTARFLFADPAIFEPLAEEFHLPISTDLNESMTKGKGF